VAYTQLSIARVSSADKRIAETGSSPVAGRSFFRRRQPMTAIAGVSRGQNFLGWLLFSGQARSSAALRFGVNG
jgi:hypothetical protein